MDSALNLPVGENGDAYHMEPVLTSMGGYLFGQTADGEYDPSDLGVGKPGSLDAAETISELGKQKVLRTSISPDNSIALFTSGKAAFLVSGPWALPDVKKSGIDYAVQPVPGFAGEQPAEPFMGAQAFMVASNAQNKPFAQEFVTNGVNNEAAMMTLYEGTNLPPAMTVQEQVNDKDIALFAECRQQGRPDAGHPRDGRGLGAARQGVRRDRHRGRPDQDDDGRRQDDQQRDQGRLTPSPSAGAGGRTHPAGTRSQVAGSTPTRPPSLLHTLLGTPFWGLFPWPSCSARRTRRSSSPAEAPSSTIVKILFLGVVIGVAVALTPTLVGQERWPFLIGIWVITAVLVATYSTKGLCPRSTSCRGLLLLAVFVVYPIGVTAKTSFTNYGDGTRSTKEEAVSQIIGSSVVQTPDAPRYNLTVGTTGSKTNGPFTFFLVDPDGNAFGGHARRDSRSSTRARPRSRAGLCVRRTATRS